MIWAAACVCVLENPRLIHMLLLSTSQYNSVYTKIKCVLYITDNPLFCVCVYFVNFN